MLLRPIRCAFRLRLPVLLSLPFLFMASQSFALSSATLFTSTGSAAGDDLGWAVGTAGDVNGDGYADVIIAADDNDAGGSNAGRAYVYYGGPGADAIADLTFTGEAAGDEFGVSVGTAGDVNGDGYADLIVGSGANDAGGSSAGRAYVYYGGPGADATADLTFTGAAAGDVFGRSAETAGDVNGDGYDDLIVGAALNDAGGSNAGRAYVFYGGPGADTVADLTFTGASAGDYCGYAVGTAGDVNGDTYADVIVGAIYNDAGGVDAGRVYVYYGGPGADAIADLTLTGAVAGDFFGSASASAGDVNGDGYADVIVGAYGNDAGGPFAGRAYVYYGGPGADAFADLTFTGAAGSSNFGWSVGTAGDVSQDGYADLIVGAVYSDAGGADAGRAYVYLGGPGADAIADLTFTGAHANDYLGNSVGTAGDVNGDGCDDVVVGANGSDAGGSNAGQAYVIAITPQATSVPDHPHLAVRFLAPRPNPTAGVLQLAFNLEETATVSVRVYDVGGHEVASPIEGEVFHAGPTIREWQPHKLAPGEYFLRATIADHNEYRKFVLLGAP